MEEQLLALVVLLTELYARLCIEGALVLGHIVAVDGARHGERRKGVEAFGLLFVARKANTAHHRQFHFVAQLSVQSIDEGVVAGILRIGQNQLTIDDVHTTQHILLFSYQHLPVLYARLLDVSRHDASLGGTVVGVDVDFVAFVIDGRILVVHVVRQLYELRVLLAQVAYKQVVAGTSASLVHIHQRFFLVDADLIETLGLCRILVEQHVLRLRGAHLVIVNLHALVDVRELLTLRGTVVRAVVESVAQPCCSRELGPFNMVAGQLSCLQVDDVELLPVAA